jgi:hypothetical protein
MGLSLRGRRRGRARRGRRRRRQGGVSSIEGGPGVVVGQGNQRRSRAVVAGDGVDGRERGRGQGHDVDQVVAEVLELVTR